jgi:hypothetical protein
MGVIDMTRGRFRTIAALGVLAATAIAAVPAGAATRHTAHHPARFGGKQLYVFAGKIAAAPVADSATIQVQITGGNRPALRALVGNATEPLSFTVGPHTSFVAWTATSRGNQPTSTTESALKPGDPVHVRVVARHGAPLARLLTKPARNVFDFALSEHASGKLYLFRGTALAVDTTAQTVTINVARGNWFALNAMLGQPTTETFHYDSATQFLGWSRRTPHTFDPSAIRAGDPITLRTRAVFDTPLASLLAAPLWKVNDHEPVSTIDRDGGTLPVQS